MLWYGTRWVDISLPTLRWMAEHCIRRYQFADDVTKSVWTDFCYNLKNHICTHIHTWFHFKNGQFISRVRKLKHWRNRLYCNLAYCASSNNNFFPVFSYLLRLLMNIIKYKFETYSVSSFLDKASHFMNGFCSKNYTDLHRTGTILDIHGILE
jgi:Gpi18-like mannosyltransferase